MDGARNKKLAGAVDGALVPVSGGSRQCDGMLRGAVVLNSVEWSGSPSCMFDATAYPLHRAG